MSNAVRSGVALALTAVMTAVICLDSVPLGVAGEWTWDRVPLDSETARTDVWLGGLVAAVWAAGVLSVVLAAVHRSDVASAPERAAWLTALTAVSIGWAVAAQSAAPEGYDLAKWPRVLYYPASSGYFFLVRYESGEASVLETYRQRVASGEVLHIGTHPPGLFLLYDVVLRGLRSAPRCVQWLTDLEPTSFRAAASWIRAGAQRDGLRFDRVDEAALFAVGLLALCSWAAVIPTTYWIAARWRGPAWGLAAAGCWPFVPAPLIFMPKSDVLFSGLAIAAVAVWVCAMHRRSASGAILGAALFWVGAVLSLVFAAVGLVAALIPILEQARWPRGPNRWPGFRGHARRQMTESERHRGDAPASRLEASGDRNGQMSRTSAERAEPDPIRDAGAPRHTLCALYLLGAGVFIAAVTVFGLVYRVNLPKLWWQNAKNHAAFYSAYSRSYWSWLLVNPFEACFAVGPIVTLTLAANVPSITRCIRRAVHCCVTAAWKAVRVVTAPKVPLAPADGDPSRTDGRRAGSDPAAAWAAALAGVWGYLWLSGKNSGEAARLWIPLFACAMPLCAVGFATWCAGLAESFAMHTGTGDRPSAGRFRNGGMAQRPSLVVLLLLLALQAVYCLVAAVRVHGFHYP